MNDYALPDDDPALYNKIFPPNRIEEIHRKLSDAYSKDLSIVMFYIHKLEVLFRHDTETVPSVEEVSRVIDVEENLLIIDKLVNECSSPHR